MVPYDRHPATEVSVAIHHIYCILQAITDTRSLKRENKKMFFFIALKRTS